MGYCFAQNKNKNKIGTFFIDIETEVKPRSKLNSFYFYFYLISFISEKYTNFNDFGFVIFFFNFDVIL